ncbi:MAG TPA: dihydroorotase [Terriglobia bacterium]|nr:dihydroorotase [Terriglobia bacterium]
MSSLLIKGGHVISPEDQLDGELDVLVEGGVIRQIAPQISLPVDEILEAAGKVVSPGFVDIHVHLREPGGEISETLETGLAAAVSGGFTAICPMPNTKPVIDRPELVRAMIEKSQRIGLARVFPIAAVSMGSQGESLADFQALAVAGAVGFSDDGRPVKTAGLLKRALDAARELNVPLMDHCEDPSLSALGVINEGPVSRQLNVRGIPGASEDVCVARDLVVTESMGARLHVCHVSTSRSVELVRLAKRRGIRVTCEATPHHFTLTDQAVLEHGTNAKVNPPLRSAQDVEAVVAGLQDGTVDAIASDHAPHAPQLKAKPLGSDAPFGLIGLESALGVAITRLVHTGKISMWHLISLMSTNPARIVNQPYGRLSAGAPADITIFDPQFEWTYQTATGRSKSRNSPFDGWNLKGAVMATVVGGRVVYRRN